MKQKQLSMPLVSYSVLVLRTCN